VENVAMTGTWLSLRAKVNYGKGEQKWIYLESFMIQEVTHINVFREEKKKGVDINPQNHRRSPE
jgi:hypothetical protein